MTPKLTLLALFTAISSFAMAQNTLDQRDTIAKALTAIDGKAIVYIVRPSSFALLIKMSVECDNVRIGSTKSKKYIYDVVNPGTHVFVSKAENEDTFEITLEANKIYYIKQEVKMGVLYAETKLALLTEEEGKKFLQKCKLSKDNVYNPQP